MRVWKVLSIVVSLAALVVVTLVAATADESGTKTAIYPEVQKYVDQRIREFDQIPDERKTQLKKLASYVKSRIESKQPARLTFICTHNSRRSHMSQIWASTAAAHFGVQHVETFSGGTETTAFNPRAIAALQRAGIKIEKMNEGKNPHYAVRFQETDHPLECFSKVYSESPNPQDDFCAVMTCTQADKNCPMVEGASLRVGIPFEDPKTADNTAEEAARYDERCDQISREMLFLFSQAGK